MRSTLFSLVTDKQDYLLIEKKVSCYLWSIFFNYIARRLICSQEVIASCKYSEIISVLEKS
jgi:hypothetical protein